MSNSDKLKIRKQEIRDTSFKYLSIIRNTLFGVTLVSQTPYQKNAIFARPFNAKNAPPQQLTSNIFNVKSNFHGYGGTPYKCVEVNNLFYLIWIDQLSNSLWFQTFQAAEIIDISSKKYLLSVQEPRQLSKSINGNFDSSFIITETNFLYGLCEVENRDYLFSLNLEKTEQDLNLINKFDNFAGDLSSNTSANLISWIEWDTPNMPWEKNNLFFAEVGIHGAIRKIKKFSNRLTHNKNISFFQPHWISEEILVCSEDSSGWWNLLFIDLSDMDNILVKKRIKRKSCEFGTPQWVSGTTFFSGSMNNLVCLAKKEKSWILEQYENLQFVQELNLPFSSVSDFCVFDKKLVLKGDGFDFMDSLIEIDLSRISLSNFFKEIIIDNVHTCSKPESFWFKGFENRPTHSFIYRPLVRRFSKPPLLIKAHSGPTACFDGSYNSEVQYWLAKGFFVAEVNYGGSSGFGRDYRNRLNCKWGIVDSFDCKALVIELLKLDLIDSDKIAIFGNSAGGLTALNSLCFGEIYQAAICKYPVTDLTDMHQNTHRFEKDYLNSLIGNYEEYSYKYRDRSPINKINKIKRPILLFHGKKDSVISYKQSLKFQEQLTRNNKYSEVIVFENEGHGFKDIANKKIVMNKTEKFLKLVFNI